ncbi:SPOR domain-containing protein [Persicitalea sp.]|uniref:HU domain-containing protein n=1 Tax=Persicitalea sp. TaxID=3100273 RepID=UPI00359359AB
MIHVDKYIRKLLFEFDCVIIPDFGGILTHRVGVKYDESARVFRPSGKRLAFNEILKIDDGLLAYYLAVGEEITHEQALEAIRQFVDSFRSELSSSHAATIDKIGSFSTNYEGKLIFEPDYTQNYDQEWFGLEDVSAYRYERLPNWQGQEKNVEDTEVFVANDVSIIPLPTKSNLRWGWAAAAVVICAASAASYLYEPSDNSLLSSLNPISIVKDFYPNSNEVETDIPTAFEVNTPINVVYFQELKPEFIPVVEESTPEAADRVNVVNIDLAPPAKQAKEDYFLIAGAFEGQKNARKLRSQLLRQGLSEATILDRTSGKYILVAAGSYETHSQAMQDKSKIDGLTQAESWVYHRK